MRSEYDKTGRIRTRREVLKTRWEVTKTRWGVTRTSLLLDGWSHSQDQDSGRVREISNMFDIFTTHHNMPGNYNGP